jgi:hypothetical protein
MGGLVLQQCTLRSSINACAGCIVCLQGDICSGIIAIHNQHAIALVGRLSKGSVVAVELFDSLGEVILLEDDNKHNVEQT